MTRLWIVRAGNQGDRELAAVEQGRLLPGFLEVGDLRRFPDRGAIMEHLEEVMPDGQRNRLRNFAAQLNQFAHTIQIGEVTGDYTFNAEDSYKHSRPVKWSQESVPRDTFKQNLRHSLGAFMTICEVKRNAALDRMRAVLETGADPGSLLGEQGLTPAQSPDEGADAEDYAVDIEDIANQQIVSLTDIPHMPSKFVEFVPLSHRQGNCIPYAAIRWHDFGNRPALGRPLGHFSRHPDTPLLSLSPRRRFPRPTPERVFVADHQL